MRLAGKAVVARIDAQVRIRWDARAREFLGQQRGCRGAATGTDRQPRCASVDGADGLSGLGSCSVINSSATCTAAGGAGPADTLGAAYLSARADDRARRGVELRDRRGE
jgi:hypothetical protein